MDITLSGSSVAARYSGFYIKEWKVMLDAGLQSPYNPKYIFITHSHSDHISKLPDILTGICTKPKIYVPAGVKDILQKYLDINKQLCASSKEKFNGAEIIEVKDGQEIIIKVKGKTLLVKVFHTDHTISSVGYAFSEYRNKLKKQYIGLPKDQFKKLIKDKVVITEPRIFNLLIYTGDTKGTIFKSKNIDWNSYNIILTECTYLQELSPKVDVIKLAEKNGHNYFKNIEHYASIYKDTTFMLCHWSTRYTRENIIKYIKEKNYKNIIAWEN